MSVVGVFVVLIRELYVLIIRITMEARGVDFMNLNNLGQSGGFLPGPYYTLCTLITRIRYYYIIIIITIRYAEFRRIRNKS